MPTCVRVSRDGVCVKGRRGKGRANRSPLSFVVGHGVRHRRYPSVHSSHGPLLSPLLPLPPPPLVPPPPWRMGREVGTPLGGNGALSRDGVGDGRLDWEGRFGNHPRTRRHVRHPLCGGARRGSRTAKCVGSAVDAKGTLVQCVPSRGNPKGSRSA